MPEITYIEANGHEHRIDVPEGYSIMEGARNNSIPGILADCSGSCACGTCKVIVDERWRTSLPAMSELEGATIEMFDDIKPGERLSCQLVVTGDMDGLVIRMPEKQF